MKQDKLISFLIGLIVVGIAFLLVWVVFFSDSKVCACGPTIVPTIEPTQEPTVTPTQEPTVEPTKEPEETVTPTVSPEPTPVVTPVPGTPLYNPDSCTMKDCSVHPTVINQSGKPLYPQVGYK